MGLEKKQSIKLSGHQTFPFRYGWLEKGMSFLKAGNSFRQEDAFVELGVGKNMAESIKYWCEMADLLETESKLPSSVSQKLLGEKGWDPFLEDDASLWLLHWKMITNSHFFTSGSAIFSLIHKPEFSKFEISEAIKRYLLQEGEKIPSDSVLKRDIDCYLRIYSGPSRALKKGEESFDCPFQDLGLIHPIPGTDMFRFSIGSKVSLPPEVICYAVWDYLTRDRKRSSMRLQEALYHTSSPGQVFKLDENAIVDALSAMQSHPLFAKHFNFTETSGIAMIHCNIDQGDEILDCYYKRGALS